MNVILHLTAFATKYFEMRILLITSLLLLHTTLFAQLGGACSVMGPQDSTQWGIGAIKLDNDKYLKGINHGKTYTIGSALIRFDNSTTLPIKRSDMVFAGHYGNQFLKVFEIKNTLYKVLVNSTDGGLWIDFNELNSKDLTFNTYYAILFNDNPASVGSWRSNPGSLGVNLFESCLNLRADASADSKIIKCISRNVDDRKFHRIDIAYHDGAWAFIVVNEFVIDSAEKGEGCHYKLQHETRGWAKVIDDTGYPNLWFSVTNY